LQVRVLPEIPHYIKVIMIDIKISIYPSFEDRQRVAPDDCPKTEYDFESYQESIENQIRLYESKGHTVHRIVIRADEYEQWLVTADADILAMKPWQQRDAYMVAKQISYYKTI
jgi:hypothetical protein